MLTVGGSSFKPPEGCNVGLFSSLQTEEQLWGGDADPSETTTVAVLGSGSHPRV